jgi:glucokinase
MKVNPCDLFLGFDVGGTKCAAIVGDACGNLSNRIQWPSNPQRGPKQMISNFLIQGKKLISQFPSIVSIGVTIGGPLNAEQGIICSPPNLPGWDKIPLKSILENKFKIPVYIEHDAAACALAEYQWGTFRGKSRIAYLTCGTGFGAGFVFDGRIYRGVQGRSSEIGHARYSSEGPVAFGKVGSIEAFCSGSGIGRLASWKFPNRWKKPPSTVTLAKLAQDGDSDAWKVLQFNARAVGDVCAFLADTLFLETILLGSLASHLGKSWTQEVLMRFRSEVHSETRRFCRVRPATLEKRLQDLSAIGTAIQGALKGRKNHCPL